MGNHQNTQFKEFKTTRYIRGSNAYNKRKYRFQEGKGGEINGEEGSVVFSHRQNLLRRGIKKETRVP